MLERSQAPRLASSSRAPWRLVVVWGVAAGMVWAIGGLAPHGAAPSHAMRDAERARALAAQHERWAEERQAQLRAQDEALARLDETLDREASDRSAQQRIEELERAHARMQAELEQLERVVGHAHAQLERLGPQ